jgi:AraC-like DNA-binding protein
MINNKIEIAIHLFFWIFILSALNVDWTANWFDQSIRPSSPAPLSVMIFAIFFYVNTFVLLPKYFSHKTWKKYIAYAFLLFILPELIRMVIYRFTISDTNFAGILFSRDSFLFGAPSPFFIAINASFIYRFTKDRLLKKNQMQKLDETTQKKSTVPYEDSNLLSDEEANVLEQQLNHQLETEEIFLNPELTLRDVAEAIGSTEKKVSYLLNQYLKTSFYEFINKHRVEKFKTEVAKSENKTLSIVGIAFNCGFSSKSSFYRAFKSQVSMSPSEYIKISTQRP